MTSQAKTFSFPNEAGLRVIVSDSEERKVIIEKTYDHLYPGLRLPVVVMPGASSIESVSSSFVSEQNPPLSDDEDDIMDALYTHPDLQPGEFNVCFPSQSFPYRPLADVAIGEQVWISNWSMTGNSKQAAFRKGAPVFPVPLPFASLCLHRVDAGCVVRLDYTIDLTFPANDQLEDVFDSLPVTGWEKSGMLTATLPGLWNSPDDNWKNAIKTAWKTNRTERMI